MKKKGKKSKKKFSLFEEYKKSWRYIKESKNFIYIIILIFLFFVLIGFAIPTPEEIKQKILDFIKNLLAQTQGMSQAELIFFIFWNNLKSTFFAIIFGFVLGIIPVFSSIANGYLIGFVSLISVQAEGISSLWRLFPHGIFELPAIFISLGLGLRFANFIFKKEVKKDFIYCLKNNLRVFLLFIIPLLLIASVIEGTLIFFV